MSDSTKNNSAWTFWAVILWIAIVCLLASFVKRANAEYEFTPPAARQERSLLVDSVGERHAVEEATPAVEDTSDDLIRIQYRALAQVNTANGQGSALLIADRPDLGLGLCLSCRHVCVQKGHNLVLDWVWAKAGSTPAKTLTVVQGNGFDTDMGLIVSVLPKNIQPVEVSRFHQDFGPWVAAGYRDKALRTAGPCDRMHVSDNGLLTMPVAFIKGMSGGACFDSFGRCVGVVVASDDATIGVSSDGPLLQQFVSKFLITPSAKAFLTD